MSDDVKAELNLLKNRQCLYEEKVFTHLKDITTQLAATVTKLVREVSLWRQEFSSLVPSRFSQLDTNLDEAVKALRQIQQTAEKLAAEKPVSAETTA